MSYRLLWASIIFTAANFQGTEASVTNFEKERTELSATVEHDCAPWDGAAFGLWIPAARFGGNPDSWIYLRIWQDPDKSKTSFVFSDKTGKIGNVRYYLALKSPQLIVWEKQPHQELKGQVRFIRINESESVLGEFDFLSEKSIHLKGNFEARWINKMALCG